MQRCTISWIIALCATLCLTQSVRAQQPTVIFDGQTLSSWTTVDGKPVTKGWEVIDGMIHLDPSSGRSGHIVTAEEYGDFDLQFEWKIAARGNSGIKYRVRKFNSSVLGCEYQILDDGGYGPKLKPKGSTGALYDIYEPSAGKSLKPADEFNRGRIIVCGNHIEHWLNGQLIVSVEAGSSEWHQRIADSKFADVEGFGQNRYGKIMLTDHGSETWYRNIELRRLEPLAVSPLPTTVVCQPVCRPPRSSRGLLSLFNFGRRRCR